MRACGGPGDRCRAKRASRILVPDGEGTDEAWGGTPLRAVLPAGSTRPPALASRLQTPTSTGLRCMTRTSGSRARDEVPPPSKFGAHHGFSSDVFRRYVSPSIQKSHEEKAWWSRKLDRGASVAV